MNKKLLRKKQIDLVINRLIYEYPQATCSLNYNSPLMLTVALILAAQCTDNMVNKITPILFKKYPTVEDLASANTEDIENIIKPCGYYKSKAKNIVLTASKIINNFNSNVPSTMEQLCTLSGIGRKSSNIILQECFGLTEGIAVDTHVTRLSYRLGFTKETLQDKIELDLMKKISKKYWSDTNHIFVYHGRAICEARRPKCNICILNDICPKNGIYN
ncbi:MAG: endonuclease III [Clostridia bacterium]|nr:endonuclease III [Clostridia bacterium]